MIKLCIVDTKAANFNSVVQALKRLGVEPQITRDVATLQQADKLILPGVGSAIALMQGILGHEQSEQGYQSCCANGTGGTNGTVGAEAAAGTHGETADDLSLVNFLTQTTKPVLGICLGMQVETERSLEVPLNSGMEFIKTLGVIPGEVKLLNSQGLALPHMGWNTVRHNDHPLFKGIAQDSYFYFVHSYCVDVGDYTIAQCEYGQTFSAALAKDNFMGVQFHPEKSGANGAKLIENFVKL